MMTEEEKNAEHVKSMASACFSELTILRRSQNSLEQIVTRHWEHPAFQDYMRDMGLKEAFAPYRLKKD
jgi:hypothetical protein